MELNNDFRVGVDRPTAWKALTDLERIAPLLPGAQLQEVDGDEYRGIVKVKVGPIQAQYKGTATLVETDESAGRMVMKASGRDTRGQGNASATITITVADDGGGTKVTASTDLTISGKVAQFGRGVLADVSSKLIGQFADNLEKDLSASPTASAGGDGGTEKAETNGAVTAPAEGEVGPGTTAPTTTAATTTSSRTPTEEGAPAAATHAGSAETASTGPRRIDSPEAEPVDLFDAAGNPLIKRLLPVVGGAALVVAVIVVLRRRRKRSTAEKALAALRSRAPEGLGDLDAGSLIEAGRKAADTGLASASKVSRKAAKQARKAAKSGAGDLRATAKDARAIAHDARKVVELTAGDALADGRKAAKQARKRAAEAAADARQQAERAQKDAGRKARKAQAKASKRAHKAQAKAAAKAAKQSGKATAKASTQAARHGAHAARALASSR